MQNDPAIWACLNEGAEHICIHPQERQRDGQDRYLKRQRLAHDLAAVVNLFVFVEEARDGGIETKRQ